ncbi:MAG: FG-GAP-like repeat-containing protein [Thermodesulfobacteriota bacterium]
MKIYASARLFSLAALLCCLLTAGLAAGQPQKSVAILPFSLNAPPDMQYLQEGIRDMLGSRIRAEAGARIIARTDGDGALKAAGGKPTSDNLPTLAKQLGADYLIFGSITALGGGISIDSQVFSAAAPAGQAIQPFYASATAGDQIMQSIDGLAWDIIEKLFNKRRPVAAAPTPQTQGQAGTPPAFTTAHPDKTFMASGGGYGIKSGRGFTKTRNFNMGLQGLDLADVDGDGALEVIIADKSEVQVFDRDETRLNLIGTVQVSGYQIHHVGAADLDSDGRAEIYISANDPQSPGSMAVEWDGKQLVTLFDNARWYIKPMEIPGTGQVLVGQAGGSVPVEEGLYVLSLNNGSLNRGERLPLPGKVNLFNFAYADLDGDGQKEVVALDDSFKLQVIRGGAVSWKSEERFGGTKRYLGGEPRMMPGTSRSRNPEVDGMGDRYKEIYVPSRILVTDVDHDGADDIILNLNPSTLTTVLPRSIQYLSGTMVGLKWNGLGLEEMWRTRKIDGYVVDYQVKSQAMKLKEGEADELFIGIVLNSGTLESLTSDQSTVVIYPFEFEAPESK